MAYRYGERHQSLLLPPSIEDYVRPDDPGRADDAFVDALDLEGLGITIQAHKRGCPEYFPRVMLKILVFGYACGAECEVSTFFLKLKIKAEESEKDAAWSLFVELATRIATQALSDDAGVEERALDSLYEFLHRSREILAQQGRLAQDFSVLTVYTLNRVMRPFLAEWHKRSDRDGVFDSDDGRREFRAALRGLQKELRSCAFCLADAAGIAPEITSQLLM
jgi:hypothetical protein